MATNDEAMIQRLLDELVDAWNCGDANAYGARYRDDATFTNVNGMFHVNREEFNRRHDYTDTKKDPIHAAQRRRRGLGLRSVWYQGAAPGSPTRDRWFAAYIPDAGAGQGKRVVVDRRLS